MSVGPVVRSNGRAHVLYGGLLANFHSPGGLLPGAKHTLGQLVQIRIFQRVCKGRSEPDWAEFDYLNWWRRSYMGEKGRYGAQSDFKPLY